ncbi:hypothetical protein HAX54_039262 [Datura stramonium]|uniref:Uncharacterized protein n=1 Tax=Datura stramonium TaxID=4076 RepID=A0ABS8VMS9_DATST|nr:hypothetical protein [Datura stramonium]
MMCHEGRDRPGCILVGPVQLVLAPPLNTLKGGFGTRDKVKRFFLVLHFPGKAGNGHWEPRFVHLLSPYEHFDSTSGTIYLLLSGD